MRLIVFLLVVILMFCDINAFAAKPFEMAGMGNIRCSEFVQALERDEKTTMPAFFSWAQGFLTALNLSRSQRNLSTRLLGSDDFSLDKQFDFLMNYCTDNPERSFMAASINLYKQLPKK